MRMRAPVSPSVLKEREVYTGGSLYGGLLKINKEKERSLS